VLTRCQPGETEGEDGRSSHEVQVEDPSTLKLRRAGGHTRISELGLLFILATLNQSQFGWHQPRGRRVVSKIARWLVAGICVAAILFFYFYRNVGVGLSSWLRWPCADVHLVRPQDTLIKPKVLFCGSNRQDLTKITPCVEHMSGGAEGAGVYATPHIDLAAVWMLRRPHNEWALVSGDLGPFIFVCNVDHPEAVQVTKERYGGSIYVVPSQDFYASKASIHTGLNKWRTPTDVEPIHRFDFDSVLEAMIDFGVQVYLVDEATFQKVRQAEDLYTAIEQLVSENTRRKKNVRPFWPRGWSHTAMQQNEEKDSIEIRDTKIVPRVLFHASPQPDIVLLEPRALSARGVPEEGAVVFATPNIGLASIWLRDHSVRPHFSGSHSTPSYPILPYIAVFRESHRELLETEPSGGIYVLPSDHFVSYLKRGMGISEWTSDRPVKPLYKLSFSSVLEGMQSLGVQVHLLDDATFKKAYEADPRGSEVLRSFMPPPARAELEQE